MSNIKNSVTWRITLVAILLVLPLNILTILFIQRLVTDSDERMDFEIQSSLSAMSSYLDRELESINRRLLYENVINTDFSALADESSNASTSQEGQLVQGAREIFKQMLDEYRVADLFYCYFPENSLYITQGSPGISREGYIGVINEISENVDSKYGTVWEVHIVDELPILISFTRWKNREFGVILNLRNTARVVQTDAGGSDRIISFTDTDNNVLPILTNNNEAFCIEILSAAVSSGSQKLNAGTDRYKIYRESLVKYGINMLLLVPDAGALSRLSRNAGILSFIALFLTVLVLPLMLFTMRRWVIAPISKIIVGMAQIESGNIDSRLDENMGSSEFNRISRSFNNMMDEVEGLKIDVYEKELEKKDISMRYLSRQIQPHFILNALNILYSYEPQEYELSRKLILSISRYFRYIVYIKNRFVTLKQEMDFVRNYLDIQSVRYPDLFFSIVEFEEGLEDYLIPPLIVQTLAENSIKHSLKIGRLINIYIITDHIIGSDGLDKVRIRVYDTGEGISDEILSEIHEFQKTGEPQEHLGVGIQNTIERLKYLYSDMTDISFERDPAGNGTNIEIVLPMIKADRSEA